MSALEFYGLSLSERLSKAGITNSFSSAIKARDAEQMRSLLSSVEYSASTVESMIKTFLDSQESFPA